ncbi:putative THUMP domain-containing protein 3-like [Diplonema papillatum]|nr:putative THUMP domain-containing protein 3-like [Diplonema papillatum]
MLDCFCTTPEGLEPLVRDEVQAAAGDAFGGFLDTGLSGVVRFALRAPGGAPSALLPPLLAVEGLRSVEHLCATLFETADGYPLADKAELPLLQERMDSPTNAEPWEAALRAWCLRRGIPAPPAPREDPISNPTADPYAAAQAVASAASPHVLFRCTCKRSGKGKRTAKPAYKSPDVERIVGEVMGERFSCFKVNMIVYTMEVLVCLSSDRVAVGLVLQRSNPVRFPQDFQTKGRSERGASTRIGLAEWKRGAFRKNAELKAAAQKFRAGLLTGGATLQELAAGVEGKKLYNELRPCGSRHDLRVMMSENSMMIPIAHALVSLSDIVSGDVVCDPMAGSGTTLLEAALQRGAIPSFIIGGDASAGECTTAALNADSFVEVQRHLELPPPAADARTADDGCKKRRVDPARGAAPAVAVCQWDATRLPLRSSSVDVVLSDLPFGNRCSFKAKLFPLLLCEFARVLRPGGRCTFLAVQGKTIDTLLKQPKMVAAFESRRLPFKVNMGEIYPTLYSLRRKPTGVEAPPSS